MRNSQTQHVHSSTMSVARVNPSRYWARMAKLTLLAMAASLLFLTCRCHALAATTNTNSQAAVAQAPGQSADPAAPGSRTQSAPVRVVRLSDVEGTVQIVRNKQTEFSHAVMNMPLTEGTEIQTGPDGRAEIEFEDGSVSRITPNSSLSLAKLSTSPTGSLETTLEQPKGLVYYELRSDPQSTFTVDFGDNKATPTLNSTFRVNQDSNPVELAVIDGSVQVSGANGGSTTVAQNKTLDVQPSGGNPYTIADGVIPNGFDQWNDQRDEEAAQEAANKTPARNQQGGGSMLEGGWGYGWGALDTYGDWYPLPGYGMVWQPYGAGPGFDPYGYGSWANMGGLGVSWISGYPWGWLPFQCGGWSYIGSFGWGWMPGGCGFGMGFGMGYGYGYGGYYGGFYGGYYGHRHPGGGGGRPRIYSAPAGYRAPMPPSSLRSGRPGQNIVHVGTPAIVAHGLARNGRAMNRGRTIDFNGTKIAPLHSMRSASSIPMRNAALVNNAPARVFQGGMHGGFLGGNRALARSGGIRGANGRIDGANGRFGGANGRVGGANGRFGRAGAFRGAPGLRSSSFGSMRAQNAAAFRGGSGFGNHAMFGSHGSFHGSAPSFGGGFHGGGFGGGGFHGGGGGFHGGGFGGGGFHGGGGGFHGGGFGGGHGGFGGGHGGGGGFGGGHGGGGGGGHH